MPILALLSGPGITKEMYESLRSEIDWEHHPVPGGILHAAGFDESGGIHIADVWESAEAMNEFVNTQLMPAMKKFNIPAPDVKVYPIHNVNAFQGIDKYKIQEISAPVPAFTHEFRSGKQGDMPAGEAGAGGRGVWGEFRPRSPESSVRIFSNRHRSEIESLCVSTFIINICLASKSLKIN